MYGSVNPLKMRQLSRSSVNSVTSVHTYRLSHLLFLLLIRKKYYIYYMICTELTELRKSWSIGNVRCLYIGTYN
jgi:hypothetical protein